jgi:AcrR family transcriptional regulator
MESKPGRQAERSRSARDSITHAALTVFALKGYAATSMDDVCLAAGCSKGGLYHHFRTKSALLGAIVDKLIVAGALLPPFDAGEAEPLLPPAAMGRVLLEVWSEAARDSDLREQLRAGYVSYLDRRLEERATPHEFGEILRIGTLIELLTRGEPVDGDAVARRLGIDRAA